MDIHDSFWPLAIFSRLFGIFCRLHPRPKETFGKRFVRYASLVLYLTVMVIWDAFGRFWRLRFTSGTVGDILDINACFTVTLTFVSISLITTCHGERIHLLFQKFQAFDSILSGTGDINRRVRKVTLAVTVVFLVYYLLITISLCVFYHMNYSSSWMGAILGMVPYLIMCHAPFVLLMHVVFFSESIRMRFKLVNNSIREVVASMPRAYGSLNTVQHLKFWKVPPRLAQMSGAFDELCDLVSDVNRCYGLSVAISYLYALVIVVSTVTHMLWYSLQSTIPALLYAFFTKVTILMLVTCLLERLPHEATATLHDVRGLERSTLDLGSQLEIHSLVSKMTHPEVEISASFFKVRSGIVISMANACFTFLIIIAQFQEHQ